MTGKIVNLTRARKARARDKDRETANGNAARFGRTRAEKAHDEDEAARRAAHLDARRREDDTE